MLKSRMTTIFLFVMVCFIVLATLTIARYFEKPIIFDSNEKDIGKETVEWIPDYYGSKKEKIESKEEDDSKVETAEGTVKGQYSVDGNTVTLLKQTTDDTDNYAAGYDLFYFDGSYKNFTMSADILFQDTNFNGYAKAGLKIAVDEACYFSVFILPSTEELCLLCTKDGGLNWIRIWPCIEIPEFDFYKPTELKLVKNGEIIEVYANGVLKHTENDFTIGADTEVKLGLTSEAVGPVKYENISIEVVD